MFKICWSTNLRNFLKEVSDVSEIFRPKICNQSLVWFWVWAQTKPKCILSQYNIIHNNNEGFRIKLKVHTYFDS